MLTQINLPNGRTWQFQYASNSYFQLTKVILPSGGYIRYTYQVIPSWGNDPVVGVTSTLNVIGRFVSPDGVTEYATTYAYSGSAFPRQVTETDPQSDNTVHTFNDTGIGSCLGYITPLETDTDFKQGSSQSLKKVHKDWQCDYVPVAGHLTAAPPVGFNSGFAGMDWGPGNPRVTAETTTIYDAGNSLTKKTEYEYDAGLSDCVPSQYFSYSPIGPCDPYTASYGNVTKLKKYDWGIDLPDFLYQLQ